MHKAQPVIGGVVFSPDDLPQTTVDLLAHDLLTREEEGSIFKSIAAGNEADREKIVRANIRLVASIAVRYVASGVSLEDLISEGIIGVLLAIEKFKLEKGFKFSTYAVWWIRQAIARAADKHGLTIRHPSYVLSDASRAKRIQTALEQDLERDPTYSEILQAIVDECAVSLEEARAMLDRAPKATVSLDSFVSPDPGSKDVATLGDTIADPDGAKHLKGWETGEQVDWLLRNTSLTPREQSILRLRYGLDDGEPKTLSAIALSLGITKERVRQVEAAALKKLRQRAAQNGDGQS